MARAMHKRCCWPPDRPVPESVEPVLHFVEQARRCLRLVIDDLVESVLLLGEAVNTRAVGDILEDRFGKRIGLLKHHADAGAQLHDIEDRVVDILAVDLDLAGHPRDRDRVVHAVDAAQEGRLATARGPMKAVTARSGMSIDHDRSWRACRRNRR